ncbi:hypothetical protein C8J57DRAFT_413909 [Mycena rebaudengoi]|nr:hypothetical protein C8J57DRAFT_413909 [Mycena rebaudengoi]
MQIFPPPRHRRISLPRFSSWSTVRLIGCMMLSLIGFCFYGCFHSHFIRSISLPLSPSPRRLVASGLSSAILFVLPHFLFCLHFVSPSHFSTSHCSALWFWCGDGFYFGLIEFLSCRVSCSASVSCSFRGASR